MAKNTAAVVDKPRTHKSRRFNEEAASTTVLVERESDQPADKGPVAPFFIVGRTEKDNGPKVLNQVFINCQIGTAQKSGTEALPLHEIPLMRAKMAENGGKVTILSGFSPGISQTVGMTKLQLSKELERLRGKQMSPGSPYVDGKYTVARGDAMVNLFPNVYGGDHGAKLTLFERMVELEEAWHQLKDEVAEAGRRWTPDDVEDILTRILPSQVDDELDNLPSVRRAKEEMAITSALSKDETTRTVLPDPKFVGWLLERHQLNDEDAQGLALIYAVALKKEPEAKAYALTEKGVDWKLVPGVGKVTDKAKAEKRKSKMIALVNQWHAMPKMA